MSLTENRLSSFLAQPWRQYLAAVTTVLVVSLCNYWLQNWTGYEALALIYLLAVVFLALVVGRGAILVAATLSALVWDFFFVPTVIPSMPISFSASLTSSSLKGLMIASIFFIVASGVYTPRA